jgi:hypothetical protein
VTPPQRFRYERPAQEDRATDYQDSHSPDSA